MRHLSLAFLLSVLWISLSGHFDGLLLSMGAVTVILAVWLASRMKLVDREGLPLHTYLRSVPYGVWLLKEVILSNVAVGKQVLAKTPDIEPSVFEVPDGQTSDTGRAFYGNSITLTPGTITIEADGSLMRIHALSSAAANGLLTREMERRVARVDGGGR